MVETIFFTTMLVGFGGMIYYSLKSMDAFSNKMASKGKKSAKKVEFRFLPYYFAKMNERK